VFLEDFVDQLAEALVDQGRDFWWIDYAPFGAKMSLPVPGTKDGKQITGDDCVVTYGSINLVRRLLRGNPWFKDVWQPTAWMNLENLACTAYYSHWRKHMLVRENAFVTWAMLVEDTGFFYEKFSSGGCLFIKPNQNLKLFTGKVVSRKGFDEFRRVEQDCYDVPGDCLCVVAKPYAISGEWRFVIADGKVVTGSRYRKDGKQSLGRAIHKDVPWMLAEELACDPWQPDVAYVVDIAQSGDEYGLLEIGAVNSAGLYHCDPKAVVDAISFLAEREYSETKD